MVLAGRYSLLDQNALNDFLCNPIAEKNNIGIILAVIFNSGILAKGVGENITYFYDKIPEEVKQRYLKIANICKKYDVPVPNCSSNSILLQEQTCHFHDFGDG